MRKTTVYFILASMGMGGAEKSALVLLKNFDREKFLIKLILFNKKGEYLSQVPEDVEIIDLKKKSRWDFLKLILGIRSIIKKDAPDVMVSFLHYVNVILVIAKINLKTKTKVIIDEQSYVSIIIPQLKFSFLMKKFILFAYRNADRLIAVSKDVKNMITKDFSVSAEKIEVIYNPIEVNKIIELSQKNCHHRFFEDKSEKFIIVSVGRLISAKNYEFLIKALKIIRKDIPAYLMIVGDGELRQQLEKLILESGLSEYADIIGAQENPFCFVRKSDVFILPSIREGFGNVIVEAMSCRVPVISTYCSGGPKEIISDGNSGLLVQVNDVEALVKAVKKIYSDKNFASMLSENAFRSIKRFEAGEIAKLYQECFLKEAGKC